MTPVHLGWAVVALLLVERALERLPRRGLSPESELVARDAQDLRRDG